MASVNAKPERSELAVLWRRRLIEWSRSGQTQVQFCRERNLSSDAFAWWKAKYRDELYLPHRRKRKSTSQNHRSDFVEVPFSPNPTGCEYELLLTNGRRIKIPARFHAETLKQLIRIAEMAC